VASFAHWMRSPTACWLRGRRVTTASQRGDALSTAVEANRPWTPLAAETWVVASVQALAGLARARALAAAVAEAASRQPWAVCAEGSARVLAHEIETQEECLRQYLKAQRLANRVVMRAQLERVLGKLVDATAN
jgi:hypothetical protein